MIDRRKIERLPVTLSGIIKFSEDRASIPCLIRNCSVHGAMLTVDNSNIIPNEFDLIIPQQQAILRVRRRWRRYGHVGVEFVDAMEQQATLDAEAEQRVDRLKELEEENMRLRVILAKLVLDVSALREIRGGET